MKQKHLILFFALILLSACVDKVPLSAYDSVNPFVGTGGHGHTFPGAIYPFGMIQPSPDTRLSGWDGCSGYHYSDSLIYGFSHTHLSGTGVEDYCDVLLMPFVDTISTQSSQYCSPFKHSTEVAYPGYYSVVLEKQDIKVQLTTSERVAVHKYSYNKSGKRAVLVDLTHRDHTIDCAMEYDAEKGVLKGMRRSSSWSPDQRIFFAMKFNCPIESIKFEKAEKGVVDLGGGYAFAKIYFGDSENTLEVKVAISAVDCEGAIKNLESEGDHTFAQVLEQTRTKWKNTLDVIQVEDGQQTDRKNFYTALYHCFTAPYLFSDVDGRYLGHDGKIHTAEHGRRIYTIFSLWDTYRALHPLLTIIERERTSDFIYTFLMNYEQGGELAMWELAGHETHCMIGNHSLSVIMQAAEAGILDNETPQYRARLLEAMVATSLRDKTLEWYDEHNYLSSEIDNESVSKTLEYAYDDWCLAEYIKWLIDRGEGSDLDSLYQHYISRAQAWKNIIDDDGFMHARCNGGFITPFSPCEVNNHFTEANSWQYSTYVPHDLLNWMNCFDNSEAFLDSLFYTTSSLEGRNQADIDGLIGMYAHGNEPSHHAVFLYTYMGAQYKTAELVRKICKEFYSPEPDGLIGNEDCGQMSAWYVLSALGFYPVCPGNGQFTLGSPLFKKATISLENGKKIVITAKNQSAKNCYVRSAYLNDLSLAYPIINARDLLDGGDIRFNMQSAPHKAFGAKIPEQLIPHIEATDFINPAPYFGRWEQRFNDNFELTLHLPVSALPGSKIYYKLNDGEAQEYSNPIVVANDAKIDAWIASAEPRYTPVCTQHLTRFIPDKKLLYSIAPDRQYAGSGEEGLVDRLYGTENYRIGGWQGWTTDAEFVIDLLEDKKVKRIGVDCLSDCRSWIFYPRAIKIEYSVDGEQYLLFGASSNLADKAMSEGEWNYKTGTQQRTFNVEGSAQARYIRVKVLNYGKLPQWHLSPGEPAWLFIDEIEVE